VGTELCKEAYIPTDLCDLFAKIKYTVENNAAVLNFNEEQKDAFCRMISIDYERIVS
jgi:hypothetical protein